MQQAARYGAVETAHQIRPDGAAETAHLMRPETRCSEAGQ